MSRSVHPQVSQNRRLWTNSYIKILVSPDRRNRYSHLPAVHFPGNAHGKHLQLPGIKIKKATGIEVPFRRKIKTVIERHTGRGIRYKTTEIRFQRTVDG